MKQKKQFYQDLPTYNGFKWSGYWDKFHHFTKKVDNGYLEIKCTESDIESGNIIDMANYQVSK